MKENSPAPDTVNPPLAGLRVLELSTILAGPAVGLFLAELGADVVKLENPSQGGDPTRGWRLAGEDSHEGRCAYFCSVNWGKRSLALDLKQGQDCERLHQLLGQADILLANFRPGQAERLGLPWADMQSRYPRLIVGWITGYGPDSQRAGFDVLIQAESGFMASNGPTGGPACRMPVALIDLLTAHQLKEGLLVALLERQRTGLGRTLQVSLWDTALASLANQATNYLMAGYDAEPAGSEHPNLFPYGTLLDCRDGPVLLAVGTDGQFAALCQVLGCPELARGCFAHNAGRVAGREALRPPLQQAAAQWESAPLLAELERLGVPAGRLQKVSQALSSLPEPLRQGPLAGVRSLAFSGFARPDLLPPPRLGEHTEEVLRDWLSLPAAG